MNERFHALVFFLFVCFFFPDDKWLKINIERKEEEEKKTNMRVIIFPCFKKEKKIKKICCQKETGHRYNAKTRAESARFVIAKWLARCPRYNIIRWSESTEMIQCIHTHIFNQLKKIDRKVMAILKYIYYFFVVVYIVHR